MQLQEAFKIFELSNSATEEDIKKQYKKLSKKYHPDICKEPDAEQKFKKINEAYSVLQNKDNQQVGDFSNPFGQNFNLEDLLNNLGGFGGFSQGRANNKARKIPKDIFIEKEISFKEAMYGCSLEFSYSRDVHCELCQGEGKVQVNNGCTKCNGEGKVTQKQGNMVYVMPCGACGGQIKIQNCNSCKASGVVNNTNTQIKVNIPAGIDTNANLRLSGMGNFSSNLYSDVILKIKYQQNSLFNKRNNDLTSTYSISLLDAFKGIQDFSVETLDGIEKININSCVKNKDEIRIPNKGIGKVGDLVIILDVKYPENISDLIGYMENKGN